MLFFKKIIYLVISVLVILCFALLSSNNIPVVMAINSLNEYQARQEELQRQGNGRTGKNYSST